MSTIIFEGNTYTFGVTVSANPGTGTTSYVFGGLNAGQTYGFIIWAFNSGGTSGIVGPVNLSTLSDIAPESREMIGAFAYLWGSTNGSEGLYYNSGSTVNILYDSENMSSIWWAASSLTRSSAGVTLPNGRNNGIIFTTPSAFNFYDIAQRPQLEGGATYMFSFYLNETLGSAGCQVSLFRTSGSDIMPRRQTLPILGSWSTASAFTNLEKDAGLSGWVRYGIEFIASFGDSDDFRGLYYVAGLRTPNISGVRNYYIGSPQIEKMI